MAGAKQSYAELRLAAKPTLLEEGSDEGPSLEPQRALRVARVVGLLAAGVLVAAGALALLASPRQAESSMTAVEDKAEMAHVSKPRHRECSADHANCNETKCCKTNGTACYEKNTGKEAWAMCRPDCVPGPDPTDPDPKPWSCKELGKKTPGNWPLPAVWPGAAPWVAKQCSNSTEDCSKSRCCKDAGFICFKKNDKTARCKPDCTAGIDVTDFEDDKPWDCKQMGQRTPGIARVLPAAKWVNEKCSDSSDNCKETKCCKGGGLTCFEKNDSFAMCRPSCEKGMWLEDTHDWHDWTCKALGSRTPGLKPPPHKPKPAQWVKTHCALDTENCMSSRCCQNNASTCYAKNATFGQCMYRCAKGEHKPAGCEKPAKKNAAECKHGEKWTCDALGPRSLRPWGRPALFCMHVFRMYSYEADIVRAQLEMDGTFRGGIFSCDQYAVYAADAPKGTLVGDGPLGPVRTMHFDNAPVWTSKDGTAANTLLFMNVWEAVKWENQYKCCDWTIKADPDAVVLPDRLRYTLKKYGFKHPKFVLTCNKGFADGPMMFGALEAIMSSALAKYFEKEYICRSMPWQSWGEDLWMSKCMGALGIWGMEDDGMVGDGLCYGSNCGNGFSGAYHPFKNKDAWMNCYWQSTR